MLQAARGISMGRYLNSAQKVIAELRQKSALQIYDIAQQKRKSVQEVLQHQPIIWIVVIIMIATNFYSHFFF